MSFFRALPLLLFSLPAFAAITLSPASVPNGTQGVVYNATLTASGGSPGYNFALVGGVLPNGISLNANGVFAGTPAVAGTYNFTVRVTDSAATTGDFPFTLFIASPSGVQITTTSLPDAQVNQQYNTSLSATGGSGGYTWEFVSGSGNLPNGLTYTSGGLILGSPNVAGAYNFIFQVRDSGGSVAQANLSIRVNSNTLSILTNSLPGGSVNATYNQTVVAAGGIQPYSFGLNSGTLPAGLNLSTGGVISGTPTSVGSSTFELRVTDGSSNSALRTLSINISLPQLAINQAALPSGLIAANYSASVSAVGGTAPYSFAVVAGTLPPGIVFSSNGVFSGSPTALGSYAFTLRVTDATSATSSTPFTIAVNSNSLTITTSSLANGVIGQFYSVNLLATGGTPTYNFQIISGAPPQGLSLASNGTLSGTPSASGTSNFTVRVTDANGAVAQASYTLTVGATGLAFTSTALANGQVGQVYSGTLTASGGTTPYTFSLINGNLPPGLILGSNGNVSGIPTTAGNFQGTFLVQDVAGASAQVAITIAIVSGGFNITTPSLNSGSINQPYSAAITATGGTQPYTFFVSSGSLPPGIILGTNGILSGTPTTGGNFTFTVRVTDNFSNQAQATYTLSINSSNILITNATLPQGQLNQAYSTTLTATGGVAPYGFSIIAGSVPVGLGLANNGVLSGTPTASGTYNFTVRVLDSQSQAASFNLVLVVSATNLTIATTNLPIGIVGTSYNALVTATGGVGPYIFDITSGGLPNGLSLTGAGGITGNPSATGGFSFTIRATDSQGATTSAVLTIQVNSAGTLTITTTALPAGQINQSYAVSLSAVGGSLPYSFSISSGALPAGLALSSNGVISGTPSAAGNFAFVIRANDNAGNSTQAPLTISITAPGFYITTTAIPSAQLGQYYTTTFAASGGAQPYTWALVSGSLPSGFSLSSSGVLSGLASTGGTFSLVIRATDANGTSVQSNLSLFVGSTFLAFTTANLPQAFIGQQYNTQLLVNGGAAPYQFTLVSGSLPTGLSLTNSGQIIGTPTVSSFSSLTFRVTDGAGATATTTLTLAVGQSTLQFTTSSLPPASVGQIYNTALVATGGSTPYTYSLYSGTLPPGFIFSQAGVLSGTASQTGTYNLSFRVTDAANASAFVNLVLNVVAGSLQITTTSIPAGRLNQPYSQTLQSSGGTLPIVFQLLSTINLGVPPPGISVSGTGVISGTPQSTGTYTFSVRATDAQGLTAQATYTLVINQAGPSIVTTSFLAGATGQAYNQSISATGGVSPYTYSFVTGILPPGLQLNPSTGALTGTPTTAGSYTFTLRVSDSASQTADATFTLTVTQSTAPGPITISAFAPPSGILYFPYSFALSATGGREPYSWSIPVGPIPNGLRLDANGNLNGLLLVPGTYRFTVRVTDTAGATADAPLSITVAGATRLTQATVGASYSAQAPIPSLGRAPFTYTINNNALGDLPPGVSLNANGSFTGAPNTPGEFTFGVLAQDASGFRGNLALTIPVAASAFSIITPGLPGGVSGTLYSQTLQASGGREPYSWVISSGTLPNGLNLNPLNGLLTGTPTIQGTNFFTVKVTDATGASATAYYGISIGVPGSPIINAITSAASYASNGIAPGELLTIFGGTLGPQTLTSFSLVNNTVPTLLSSTRVLFDGVAAPIIYTQYGQLSVIAPYNLAGRQSVRVVVEYQGFQSTPFLLPVVTSKPALFTVDGSGQGPGAILNENGSINTSSNRAAKQSVVVLYATGGGAMTPDGQEGQVSSGISSLTQQTLVTINSQPTTVQYSGNAPGLVQGVIQINVKLPPGTISGANTVTVQIGPNKSTANVTVWVE